jgi:hypothetical protein
MLIRDMRPRNPKPGLVDLWCRPWERGHSRCVGSLYRALKRTGASPGQPKKKAYIPKPYEQMAYPGERVHRMDSERFYPNGTFYSPKDANEQLQRYQRWDNSFPLLVLGRNLLCCIGGAFFPKCSGSFDNVDPLTQSRAH